MFIPQMYMFLYLNMSNTLKLTRFLGVSWGLPQLCMWATCTCITCTIRFYADMQRMCIPCESCHVRRHTIFGLIGLRMYNQFVQCIELMKTPIELHDHGCHYRSRTGRIPVSLRCHSFWGCRGVSCHRIHSGTAKKWGHGAQEEWEFPWGKLFVCFWKETKINMT